RAHAVRRIREAVHEQRRAADLGRHELERTVVRSVEREPRRERARRVTAEHLRVRRGRVVEHLAAQLREEPLFERAVLRERLRRIGSARAKLLRERDSVPRLQVRETRARLDREHEHDRREHGRAEAGRVEDPAQRPASPLHRSHLPRTPQRHIGSRRASIRISRGWRAARGRPTITGRLPRRRGLRPSVARVGYFGRPNDTATAGACGESNDTQMTTTPQSDLTVPESIAVAALPANRASRRVLEPAERISEVLFGLIMVLTFTGSLSIVEAGSEDVHAMLVGALGCNLAWGVIDALFYLMGCLAEKGRNLATYKAVLAAPTPEEARRLI